MYRVIKRILDIIFSFSFSIILLPLGFIIGILIKIDSRGPIIFTQHRIGANCRVFRIYKFRTMHIDTPDLATDLMQKGDKNYITRAGKFLRRTSLDELPQLINILKGEMSFIGPRPALYNQYSLIKMREAVDVNSLMPGLTGWAQINGRDDISDNLKVSLDEYYRRNISFKLDVVIILNTIISVINGRGTR